MKKPPENIQIDTTATLDLNRAIIAVDLDPIVAGIGIG
jgi:outer membrane protein W